MYITSIINFFSFQFKVDTGMHAVVMYNIGIVDK